MQKKGLAYKRRSKTHRHTNPIITKKLLVKAYLKAQSAMEYLMTYGWAILIIAVVLGALFQLGVFNANNFAPKAPPGSCQVFRPYGPGTTQFINLEGICSGELPQYVAQFSGSGSKITASIPSLPQGAAQRTITAWYNEISSSDGQQDIFAYGSLVCRTPTIPLPPEYFEVYTNGCSNNPAMNAWCTDTCLSTSPNYALNTWIFVAYEYNGTYQIGYTGYTGGLLKTANIPYNSFNTQGTTLYIGQGLDRADFIGYISNVQVYNTSLSPSEIQALYQEGIGGAPIDLQHLVAWYPLNGDANDYSGNGNNGVPSNVKFVSNWWQGYTPP
jgi:hypothetical protein